MLKTEWIEKGFVDEPVPAGANLKEEIRRMCREKKAIVLAHYYTRGEIQEVADFVGDSLALARKAAETDAEIMVMCGVHFMAETCKILSPDKTVLAPDLGAGCSLADSCPAEELRKFKDAHPGYTVVSYVNTTAAVKALTDVVVTRNGGCHVHERFSADAIAALKAAHPGAEVLAHLECKPEVLALADVVGSTAVMLKHVGESDCTEFIVATESGILHEMRRACPGKTFIPVPPAAGGAVAGSGCNECEYMKMNTLEKLYNTLKHGWPEVTVDEAIAAEAIKPIKRMLELS